MAETIVSGPYPPKKVKELVAHMVRALGGQDADRWGFRERYWGAYAHSIFSSVFKAFLVKSQHGTDELGNNWEDLKLKTKAYGRMDARSGFQLFDNRAVRHPDLRVRPTLPPNINRQWAGFWLGNFRWYSLNKSGKNEYSKRLAGKFAWGYFKSKGYPTLLELTASLDLPILNSTGTLQRSLFPAPLSRGVYFPIDPNQVYKPRGTTLTIGTKVPYAEYVTMKRNIWPDNTSVWHKRASVAARDALYQYFPEVLQRV